MRSRIASLVVVLGASLLPRLSYAQTYSKTETIAYSDNLTSWVLGQVKRTTTNGVEVSRSDYDPTTALPTATYSFGNFQQGLTYNADGTLATLTDGNNNVTRLSNYKRGIAQRIDFPVTPDQPAGTSVTAVVDDLGQVISVVGTNGGKTCYGYDAMGRVNLIQYPSETTPGQCGGSWNQTQMSFSSNYPAADGLPAGQWRQRVTTGNAVKETLYDGLWRPVVEQTYDVSNVNATISEVVTRYDANGNVAFKSYPQRTVDPAITNTWANPAQVPNALGTTSHYDALGRPISATQDAESGVQVTTTTTYLPGYRTQISDPNKNLTTITYMAFDEPSTDWPVRIDAPEGVSQIISRDVYGKPLSITQSGSSGGYTASLTKTMVYDSYQRLCRSTEPESGDTVVAYDGANNLAWRATGLSITGTGCGQSQVPSAAQTVFSYDPMNRVKTMTSPSGTQSSSYTYDAAGNVKTSVSGIAIQGYSYNLRNLPTSEGLWLPGSGMNWSITKYWDAYGHLSSISYPNGESVSYAPDALGRPTQAGSYASGVQYFPNGSEAGYALGNGIIAVKQLNARMLPYNLSYGLGASPRFSEDYSYDANADLTKVTDLINGQNNQTLSYDGLNRLTSASAPNAWGSETYAYDALNNLRKRVTGGYTFDLNVDAANRLVSSTIGGNVFASYINDARGNRTVKGFWGTITNYSFDAENQLLGIPGVASYAYDALGRRVMKTPTAGGTAAAIYSFYNHDGQLMYGYNAATGQGTNYIYLNGKLIARHVGTATTYLLVDRLGSPVRETDSAGNVTASFSYRPYGSLASGPNQSQPGFTGHVNDPETGLTYMQARYYDPGAGRFLSVDPVTPSAGALFGFNRYDYTDNNPINHIDPDGRCPQCAAVAGVVGTIAVGAGIGAGVDYLVQKAFHPGQPVNMNEVKVAAVLGGVSAGTGVLAMAGIESGGLTVTRAIFSNVAINGVAGGAGRIVQGQLDGKPATYSQIAIASAGNTIGTAAANGIGVAAFRQAASQGAAARMSSAAVDSPAGIGATIVNTTAAVGIGTKQTVTAAAASQAGQAAAQGATAIGQTKIDDVVH